MRRDLEQAGDGDGLGGHQGFQLRRVSSELGKEHFRAGQDSHGLQFSAKSEHVFFVMTEVLGF